MTNGIPDEIKRGVREHDHFFFDEVECKFCAACGTGLGFADWKPEFEGKVYCEACWNRKMKEDGRAFIREHVPNFCSGSTEKVYEWKGCEDFLEQRKDAHGYFGLTEDGRCIMSYSLIPGTDILRSWWVMYHILDERITRDIRAAGWRELTQKDYEMSRSAQPALQAFKMVENNKTAKKLLLGMLIGEDSVKHE